MRVVVTEATSTLASHFLQLLGSGTVLGGQTAIHLVLCDQEDMANDLKGVAMDIQDCVFPNIASISISMDFFDAVHSADVAVILPCVRCGCHDARQVEITHSTLSHLDFQMLDAAIRLPKQGSETITTKGAMSAAVAIATHIQEAVSNDMQVTIASHIREVSNDTQIPAVSKVCTTHLLCGTLGYYTLDPAINVANDATVGLHSNTGHVISTANSMMGGIEGEILYDKMDDMWGNRKILLVYVQQTYLEDIRQNTLENIQKSSSRVQQLYLARL